MKSLIDINSFLEDFGLSYGLWLLIGAVLFALLCLCFLGTVRRGKVKPRQMFAEAGWTALWCFGLLVLSLVTSWPFGSRQALWTPSRPVLFWCVAAVVIIALYIWYFRKRKKHFADKVSATAIRRSAAGSGASKYCYALLFAGMLVTSFAGICRAVGGLSLLHLLVPMCIVGVTLLLHALIPWRIWFLLGGIVLTVYVLLMFQNALAVTDFGFTPLLALIPLYLSSILPLFSLSAIK